MIVDANAYDVVQSLAGHDRGRLYMVLAREGDRLLVTDGRLRRQDHPKRKSPRHVRVVLQGDRAPRTDREIRNALKSAAVSAAAKEEQYLGES